MNALSQIEAGLDEPTVAAVASAVFSAIAAIGEGRRSFDLESQTAAARQVLDRFEAMAAAKAFMARADAVEDDDSLMCYFFKDGSAYDDDERPVVFCWGRETVNFYDAQHNHYDSDLDTDFLGVVVDPHGEYGAPVIIPADACDAVFGADLVKRWKKIRLEAEAEGL